MWNLRRATACGSLSLAVLLPVVAASSDAGGATPDAGYRRDGSSAAAERARRSEERLDEQSLTGSFPTAGSGQRAGDGEVAPPYLGIDGELHDEAPVIIEGLNGTLYIGEDFDAACFWGPRFANAMRKLARLAAIIESSGRTVVFTVAPNKSGANKQDLPAKMPHGACDRLGMAHQDNLLDRFRDPRYLGIRQLLAAGAASGRAMYWDLDTHWTTVGGTRYAQELAQRLDPRVARLQRYRNTEETILVDFNALGWMEGVTETAPTRFPRTRVRVEPTNGSPTFDPVHVSPALEWVTRPAKRTIAGRTLLLGDSFMYRAMPSLLPLFRHGRFIWTGHESLEDTARAVRKADTVVLEVVQRYLPLSTIVSRDLRRAVAEALR
jgi:hypothetical protein